MKDTEEHEVYYIFFFMTFNNFMVKYARHYR